MAKYETLCHLGTKHYEEQRLARDVDGTLYLYDWSGDAPDETDDGPLRIDFDRTFTIGLRWCYVPVLVERNDNQKSQVSVTHKGMVKLLSMLRARPKISIEYDDEGALKALVALVRLVDTFM